MQVNKRTISLSKGLLVSEDSESINSIVVDTSNINVTFIAKNCDEIQVYLYSKQNSIPATVDFLIKGNQSPILFITISDSDVSKKELLTLEITVPKNKTFESIKIVSKAGYVKLFEDIFTEHLNADVNCGSLVTHLGFSNSELTLEESSAVISVDAISNVDFNIKSIHSDTALFLNNIANIELSGSSLVGDVSNECKTTKGGVVANISYNISYGKLQISNLNNN